MLRSSRPQPPGHVYNVGDRVKCINPRSKHYTHTALVIGMGRTRLNVNFENEHKGKFIDRRDAELIISTSVQRDINGDNDNTSLSHGNVEENDDVEQLNSLLEHMAFTAATVISSTRRDPERMTTLLDSFDRAVRDHTNTIAGIRNRDNSHTSPKRRNNADQTSS
jgi:hypothetical protein